MDKDIKLINILLENNLIKVEYEMPLPLFRVIQFEIKKYAEKNKLNFIDKDGKKIL